MVLTNVAIPGLLPGVDTSGQGWVGFTAGTGDAFENHDIIDWSFCSNGNTSPPSGVPVISNFTPASGTIGTVVTISGANFSATTSANIVYFGAVQANVLVASPNSLMVMVPTGATYAPITVTVNGLTAYSREPFVPTFGGAGQSINSASFGPNQNLAAGNGPTKVVIADLDGDGKSDLVVANTYDHTVWIYQNISSNGTLTAASFASPVVLATPAGAQSPYYVEVADLDGDGKLDIIASDCGDNLISIYRNVSTSGGLTTNSFAARLDFATGATPIGVAVRDLDGDGKPEIVTANAGDATISIFQNLSTLGMISPSPPKLIWPSKAVRKESRSATWMVTASRMWLSRKGTDLFPCFGIMARRETSAPFHLMPA